MQGRSLAVACAVLALFTTTGCLSVSVTDVDTGQRLRPAAPRDAARSLRVVVPHFVLDTVQRYDVDVQYSSTMITKTWKETPGQVDLSGEISRNLRELGFQDVTYQPDAEGDRYVVGALAWDGSEMGAGEILWSSIMMLPGLILPLPFSSEGTARATVSLYDASGQRLWTKKLSLRADITAYSVWGLSGGERAVSDRIAKVLTAEVAAALSGTGMGASTR